MNKPYRFAPFFALFLCFVVLSFVFADETEEQHGLLRHVVCFKFKEDVSQQQIREVEESFAALQDKIPEILDFEFGTNNSPEGLDKGFTHCFLLTFKTAAARDIYLPHPDHKAFAESLDGLLDDVFVIDYWTK